MGDGDREPEGVGERGGPVNMNGLGERVRRSARTGTVSAVGFLSSW